MLSIALVLFACASSPPEDTAESGASGHSATPSVDQAEEVFELLQGDFDSIAQASSNPSYFEISLRMCPLDMPELGPHALYVEQAAIGSLSSPYRQRIYLVEQVGERVASHVYAIETAVERQLVGACDDPGSIAVAFDQIVERVGCTVWLESTEKGYSGGTEGTGCTSTLGGAVYATSAVTLSDSLIESWDQGWDTNGTQVWGATSGAYIFERRN